MTANYTVYAKWIKDEAEITPDPIPGHGWENPFIDVKADDWFYGDVAYVSINRLMLGTNTDPMLFNPNMALTRGMAVTVLYRMSESPDASGLENPFDDVPYGMWYADAVKWAADNKLVNGYGDGKFGPEDIITREQLALILSKYERFAGMIPPDILPAKEFADWNDISDWAKNAVRALTAQGVIGGKPNNLFDPAGEATRAEFAALLHRFTPPADGG